jgi:hypothetical protein
VATAADTVAAVPKKAAANPINKATCDLQVILYHLVYISLMVPYISDDPVSFPDMPL